jgi:tetratricopeptide (TPR) repeat protein
MTIRTARVLVFALCLAAPAAAQEKPGAGLDLGYRDMYNLQFDEAHKVFQAWQQAHPDDPLGPASDAAAYLFAEFDRMHVLESELFVNDSTFENRARPVPDPKVKVAFEGQLAKAQQLAERGLARDANNGDALFAQCLVLGLRGDYAALVEKRDLAGLGYMKNGRQIAERLLAAHPTYYDAYLAVGVENYLLSLKPAPVRWILHFTGAETDRETGLARLRITAEKGHYLLPYARLLLAVAALRDKDRAQARTLLEGLAHDFPSNHLYTVELAKLQ